MCLALLTAGLSIDLPSIAAANETGLQLAGFDSLKGNRAMKSGSTCIGHITEAMPWVMQILSFHVLFT
jgi:hypothetical protein